MAGLAAVGVGALAAYLAGVNVLAILAAAGLLVSLVTNWRRLRRATPVPLPVLPVWLLAAVPARRHPSAACPPPWSPPPGSSSHRLCWSRHWSRWWAGSAAHPGRAPRWTASPWPRSA